MPSALAVPPRPDWHLAWWARMRHLFVIKTLGICGFMWLFFIGYFQTLRHPVHPVTELPLTAFDHWIGFQPWALPAYFSLWVYVGIPAGMMRSLRQLIVYGLWAAALCGTGLLIFHFWPTAVPAGAQPADAARHAGFALIKGIDAAGNACPSLHVATAVFTAVWVARTLREIGAPTLLHGLNALWALAIVWSTLATKQHVLMDVLGGTALALAFAWPSLRWFPAARPGDPGR